MTYNESGRSYTQMVNHLQGTADGYMDNVHGIRDAQLADIVVLIVNSSGQGVCGLASVIRATRATAFAVIDASCLAAGVLTFPHEIAHLQGARHNDDPSNTPFAYGHGYVSPSLSWRTIMGVGTSCNFCLRVPYFSNTTALYPPTGEVMGSSTTNNNRSVLNLSVSRS